MENQVLEVSLDSSCIYRCAGCALGERKAEKINKLPSQVVDMVNTIYQAFPGQPFSLEVNTPLPSYAHLRLPKELFTGAKEVNLSLGIINGNDDHDLTMVQQISQVPRILEEIKKRFFERMGFSFGSSISDIGNIVTISYLLALEVARQKAKGNLFFSKDFDIAYSENNVPDKASAEQRFQHVKTFARQYLRDIFGEGFREIAGGVVFTEANIGIPVDNSYATGGGHGIGFHAFYQRTTQKTANRIGFSVDHRFLHLPQGFGKHIEPELIQDFKEEGLANIMVTPTKVHLLHSSTNMRMSDRLALTHDDFKRKVRSNTMPYVDFIHSLVQ